MPIVPAQPGDLVIALLYTDDIVDVYDDHVIGWYYGNEAYPLNPWPLGVVPIGSTGVVPVGGAITPMIEAPPPPPAGSILSPPWIAIFGEKAVAPNGMWSGPPTSLFTFLATNNGANRRVRSNFVYPQALHAWSQWASLNPDLVAI